MSVVSILPFLLKLVASVDRRDGVAQCIEVKHPHIKKGTLLLSPESMGLNVSSWIILPISSLRSEFLPIKRLEWWFDSTSLQTLDNSSAVHIT